MIITIIKNNDFVYLSIDKMLITMKMRMKIRMKMRMKMIMTQKFYKK